MASNKETRVVELIMDGSKAGSSLKALSGDVRTLQGHIRGLTPGTDDFVKATKRLQESKAQFKQLNDQVNGVSKGVSLFKNQFFQLTTAVVGGSIITSVFEKIAGIIPNMISGAAKMSDEMADMRKTTGLSAEEAKKLNSALSKFDTRTSTADLRKIAIVAGQIGIEGAQNIENFTAATDKLVVALGDEFTGGAEEVTKVLGGLSRVLSDTATGDAAVDMMHLGNALNELGANGAATGPVVADFANRIGGVGITMGLTSGQVLGLSATLQELNVSTERGGTAVTKILQKMAASPAEFARIAGMGAKEFSTLVDTDIYGAFVKVSEGSQKTSSSATQFAEMLDKLGVDGAGASEVFAKLGNNTALLQNKVDLATNSIGGMDSITSEFNIKNETFGALLEKSGKELNAMVNSPGVQKFLVSATMNAIAFAKILASIPKFLYENRDVLAALAIALITFNRASIIATANTLKLAAAKKWSTIVTYAENTAWWLFNQTLRANPIGLVVTAIGLLIAALVLLYNRSETVRAGISGLWSSMIAIVKGAGQMIINYYRGLGDIIAGVFTLDLDKMKAGFSQAAGAFSTYGKNIGNAFSDGYKKGLDKIPDYTKTAYAKLKKLAEDGNKEAEKELARRNAIVVKKPGTPAAGISAGGDTNYSELSKEQQKYNDNTRKLLEELSQVKAQVLKDEEASEAASLEAKFQKRIKEVQQETADAGVKKQLVTALEEQSLKEINELHAKYAKERAEAEYTQSTKNISEAQERQKIALTKELSEGLITQDQFNTRAQELESEHLQQKLVLAQDYGKSTIEIEKDIADHTLKIQQDAIKKKQEDDMAMLEMRLKYTKEGSQERLDAETEMLNYQMQQELTKYLGNAEAKKLIDEFYLEQKEKTIDEFNQRQAGKEAAEIQQFGDMATSIMGSINKIETDKENAKLAAQRKETDEKKQALQVQMDAELQNENLTSAEKEKIQKRYKAKMDALDAEREKNERAVLREQAEREKTQKIFEATINMFANIARTAWNPALSITTGVIGALNIAAIASTPLPEYDSGGLYKVKGEQSGRTYNASYGGRLSGYYSSPTLALVAENKPEYVVPNRLLQMPRVANMVGIIEGIRVNKQFDVGGATSSGAVQPMQETSTATIDTEVMTQAFNNMSFVMQQLIQKLNDPLDARISYDILTRATEEVESTKKRSVIS